MNLLVNPLIDLQPANILFSVDNVSPSDVLLPAEFCPVKWLPGVEVDDSAPQYLLSSQRPRGMLDDADASTLQVKIGDMGGGKCPTFGDTRILLTTIIAIWSGRHDFPPVTPIALRAPELLQKSPWDGEIDIWALGCLVRVSFPPVVYHTNSDNINIDISTCHKRTTLSLRVIWLYCQ